MNDLHSAEKQLAAARDKSQAAFDSIHKARRRYEEACAQYANDMIPLKVLNRKEFDEFISALSDMEKVFTKRGGFRRFISHMGTPISFPCTVISFRECNPYSGSQVVYHHKFIKENK